MRKVKELTSGWKFCLTKLGTEKKPEDGEAQWEDIDVPHDWAIYGEFSQENDPQPLENSVFDYHEGMIQIGRTGGLPIIGTGWYVLQMNLSEEYSWYALEFDGIMNHGEVYINGKRAASRPFGYSSFSVDISPYAEPGQRMEIVVKVNSMDKTSRWYPGAGLFRPVRLIMGGRNHFAYQGIQIQADYDLEGQKGFLKVNCVFEGLGSIRHRIFDPEGYEVGKLDGENAVGTIEAPYVWDVENPKLYTLVSDLVYDESVVDRVYTRFGFRKAVFEKDTGFWLNGKSMKIQGVCMHHDCGMLGAAYRESVVRKRLSVLKEMGCNALRTTHNPPCPKTLDICDELGILVLDEAFDEWKIPKAVNGYANEFPKWAERDLTDMIRRDRNHPSVILYSIGNEIPDQLMKEGRDICRWLVSICHREDPSRPVTCGFNRPKAAVENGLTEEVDIVGLNYCAREYDRYHAEHPEWTMIATETMSAVSSRGEYILPAEMEMPAVKRDNYQVNSFDYSAVACAYIPDIEFDAQKKAPYVAGQFVWTGYDYLGEPTPYREEWPSRSSYFGILDLAGMKKDRYFGFAAEWGEKPIVHLFPHWNWVRGQKIDVHCYTNQDKVRLFLNGKEVAEREKENHRIVFQEIIFEPGELKAVGYKVNGNVQKEACLDVIHTAGSPKRICLSRDMDYLWASRPDICFVEADIVDKDGILCPNADNRVWISVEGEGEYIAADAGDATSIRRFCEPYCDAFHGKLRIALKAGKEPGNILVSVRADGLKTAYMTIKVKG